MHLIHDDALAGHSGRERTLVAARKKFYWTTMTVDIDNQFLVVSQLKRKPYFDGVFFPLSLETIVVSQLKWKLCFDGVVLSLTLETLAVFSPEISPPLLFCGLMTMNFSVV